MITNTKIWNNPRPLKDNAKRTGGMVQSVKGLTTDTSLISEIFEVKGEK